MTRWAQDHPVQAKSTPQIWLNAQEKSSPCTCIKAKGLYLTPSGEALNAGGREIAGLGIEYTPDGRMGPQLGAQFAQLVKELRSEYAGAITGCAQRIAVAVFSLGPRVLTLLQQHGLTGNPAQTAQEVRLFSSLTNPPPPPPPLTHTP